MILEEVEERIAKARADGRAFLLVCVDSFDRMRGDEDMGYYYPVLDSHAQVAAYIASHQLGAWDPTDVRDWCEAIVEIQGAKSAEIHAPADWLAARERR